MAERPTGGARGEDDLAPTIGDIVVSDGRRYIFRGSDPLGATRPLAQLEDEQTGERVAVPIDAIEPAADPSRGHGGD